MKVKRMRRLQTIIAPADDPQFEKDIAALEAALKEAHPEVYDDEIGYSAVRPTCCPISEDKTQPGLVQTREPCAVEAPVEVTKEEKASRTSIFVGV